MNNMNNFFIKNKDEHNITMNNLININNNNMNNNSNNNKMFNNLNNMNFNNMKNYNVINMNENKNLNRINNIQNINMVNSQGNLMSFSQNELKSEVENNTKLNEQLAYLNFIIEKYNRKIFIEVNRNDKFEEVIKKKKKKYIWLATINNRLYIFDNKQIKNFNMTLNELGIVEDSDIKIIV